MNRAGKYVSKLRSLVMSATKGKEDVVFCARRRRQTRGFDAALAGPESDADVGLWTRCKAPAACTPGAPRLDLHSVQACTVGIREAQERARHGDGEKYKLKRYRAFLGIHMYSQFYRSLHFSYTNFTTHRHSTYCLLPRSSLSAIGLPGSTVPIDLAVSGAPSPFLLFPLISWTGMECLVGVLDRPACLLEMSPGWSDLGLEVLAWISLAH